MVGDVRELESILREAGLGEQRLKVHIDEALPHSESAGRAISRALEVSLQELAAERS